MLKSDYAQAEKFYVKMADSIGLDSSYRIGNAMKTIGYRANGEASDWMLAERGIYAVSVELASAAEPLTKLFFISDKDVLKKLLLESEPWITATMAFLMPKITCKLTQSSKLDSKYDRVPIFTTFECENEGLAPSDTGTYKVHLNYIVADGPTAIKQVLINDKKTATTSGCWIAKDCFFIMPSIQPLSVKTIKVLSEMPVSVDD